MTELRVLQLAHVQRGFAKLQRGFAKLLRAVPEKQLAPRTLHDRAAELVDGGVRDILTRANGDGVLAQ
jgi:hypothetical protein